MGAYACLWVRWGVGGTGNTKTRQRGGNYGLTDPDLGTMVGENSRTSCFVKLKQNGYKCLRMGANGFAWVK